MATHLDVQLLQDLEQIRTKIREMGDLAERAVRASIRSVVERDRRLAFAVILRDQYIDEAEKQLDRLCLHFLVRHQPVAVSLRFAYSAIKVNLELERVGDYAESIARQALKLAQRDTPFPVASVEQLVGLAVPMLHDAIQAFIQQDADLARRTIEADEAVDLVRDKLTADLTEAVRAGEIDFETFNALALVARRLERVSDQARNISMETLYMCTGEIAKHPGSDVFRVLFVDEHNACRSLMAEAIGNRLGEPGFVFTSAGLTPEPVSPATVRFMAGHGFDAARAVPRALSAVPNVEHEDVIVLLAPEARSAFPRRPRHTVLLDWSVADPSTVQGTQTEVDAAYEKVFNYISGEILDLVSAIGDVSRP